MTGVAGPQDRRIVVGFDGSPGAWAALEWAAEEAAMRSCALVVIHADRWVSTAYGARGFEHEAEVDEAVLDEAVHRVAESRPELRVTGERVPGPADAALVEASTGADLLVVGSRGLGEVARILLGSVSRYCVDHGRCPVVVVPHARSADKTLD